jgi:anti-sigma factor RsiW
MASSADRSEPALGQLAEISALADGTLDPARRDEVEGRIAGSPELKSLYERERAVVNLLHEARASDRAPAALRARIEASRPTRRARSTRRFAYGGSLAGALAAIILALVLILPGGSPGSPSVSQAALLAVRGAASAPPVPDPSDPAVKLGQTVGDVYFPNWTKKFGWQASGQRTDSINGRQAVTVFYRRHGQALAYTIVGAPSLKTPQATIQNVRGTRMQTLRVNGRQIVTWQRDDHTCVLSGPGVSASELQKLASWRVPASA